MRAMSNGNRVTIYIKKPGVIESYDQIAKATGFTRNALLERAIEVALPHIKRRATAMAKLIK